MELDTARIQRIFGIPPRDWRRILTRNLQSGRQPAGQSLDIFGYAELHRFAFYLTVDGLSRWMRESKIRFPAACCVCAREPSVWLASEPVQGSFPEGPREIQVAGIPHCPEHGSSGHARLLVEGGGMSDRVVWLSLTGTDPRFLTETRDLNQDGEVPPPWVAFPGQDSTSGFWKQSGEPWMATVFRPFWRALDSAGKTRYLQKWSAPQEWREWLEWLDQRG
ncbi:MAG TPA: hypothetical protein VMH81_08360 [Bryobacteraceae bacterium]|nr:hypothetical protein [Bryobacteraceae bacterium]